ncbi:HEPN domain-containing protein [Flavobacterium sp.]|uniref:ApeA N-terminal domain 1-containing protein n=1 Tax=Flavobacterium sp. TaxID=239 RepID=UPI002FDDA5A8
MIENFEHKGMWFLPSNPERKVHGILKYDYKNNTSILELIGSFYDYSNTEKQEIIVGTTTDGVDVTLVDCYFSHSRGLPRKADEKFIDWAEDRLPTLKFRITTILKGHRILKKEEVLFQKIYTEIYNLEEWVGISGFKTDYDEVDDMHTIQYKAPNPIKVKINENIDLEIKFFTNDTPIAFGFNKELGIKQKTILSLHSKEYLELWELIYLIRKFTYFLSTSLQIPVRMQSMELYSDKFSKKLHNDYNYSKPIQGFQIITPELKFEKKKEHFSMLFCYNDIENDFEVIMQKWFDNYEKFESPFNLVLRQFYLSQYYLETLFVNVAQASESFHSRLEIVDDSPKTEQDEEFSKKLKTVIDSVPEELKKWVESKISKPAKHHSDTRLKYLLKQFSNAELDKMIGNHEQFIKDVINSRNYYTHYFRSMEKKAISGQELLSLYLRLRLLLICGFLIESGFNKVLLEKLIKEKTYFLFRNLLS